MLTLNYNFGQILVYDASSKQESYLNWTEGHALQGFARRQSVVGFSTLIDGYMAELQVLFDSEPVWENFERVVEVPLSFSTGEIHLSSPDDTQPQYKFKVEPGIYRVTCAQRTVEMMNGDDIIDLFVLVTFNRLNFESPTNSRIVKADADLSPSYPLSENVGIF